MINIKEKTIDKIEDKQKILLYLLESFHNFCERNGLIYNVFGGTLLGCIRHNGFIPWDDDIDVVMPRDDYNKFISFYQNELLVVNKPGDKNYPYYFSKLCLKDSLLIENELIDKYNKSGIYIDIFPVDKYPKDDNNFFHKTRLCERLLRYSSYKPDKPIKVVSYFYYPFKVLLYKIFKIIPANIFINKQIELVSNNNEVAEEFLFQHGAGWTFEGKILKDDFYNRQLYKFESINVYGVKDYNKQLSMLYGDYMKLPPEEIRTTNHNNIWYISSNLYEKLVK